MLTSSRQKLTALSRRTPSLLSFSPLHSTRSLSPFSHQSNHDHTCGTASPSDLPEQGIRSICTTGVDQRHGGVNPIPPDHSRPALPHASLLLHTCFSTSAAASAVEETVHEEPPPPQSSANKGILVELGILPPYDPKAEAEAQMHETIWAGPRERSGKITSKKERRAGRVPAVLFPQERGHVAGNKELISVQSQQLATLLRKYGRSKFFSRTFEMRFVNDEWEAEAEGDRLERVLPKSVYQHPATDELLNVTFLKMPAEAGARVKVQVPLQFIGEDACPGIRKGGWLFCMRRVVPLECPWGSIPPSIDVDLSEMSVGQVLRLQDLNVRPECRLLVHNKELPVCKIAGSRSLNVGES